MNPNWEISQRTRGLRIERREETISLCMIAKNEAEHLRRCLNSAKELIDEIIVVDTGSTDPTVEIAKAFGAKVSHFGWIDDFSAARNASIESASCDWIFVLDCDEVISPKDHAAVRGCLKESKAFSGLRMTTRNYSHQANAAGWRPCQGDYVEERDYPGWFPSTKVRLFRRRPQIRFEGVVHELVEDAILRAGGAIGDCYAPVHHYGHTDINNGGKKIPLRESAKAESKLR